MSEADDCCQQERDTESRIADLENMVEQLWDIVLYAVPGKVKRQALDRAAKRKRRDDEEVARILREQS